MDADTAFSPRSHGAAAAVAVTLLLLPMLYIAGAGPACLLCEAGYVSDDALNLIYFPIIYLCERFEPFNRLMEAYIEWWV